MADVRFHQIATSNGPVFAPAGTRRMRFEIPQAIQFIDWTRTRIRCDVQVASATLKPMIGLRTGISGAFERVKITARDTGAIVEEIAKYRTISNAVMRTTMSESDYAAAMRLEGCGDVGAGLCVWPPTVEAYRTAGSPALSYPVLTTTHALNACGVSRVDAYPNAMSGGTVVEVDLVRTATDAIAIYDTKILPADTPCDNLATGDHTEITITAATAGTEVSNFGDAIGLFIGSRVKISWNETAGAQSAYRIVIGIAIAAKKPVITVAEFTVGAGPTAGTFRIAYDDTAAGPGFEVAGAYLNVAEIVPDSARAARAAARMAKGLDLPIISFANHPVNVAAAETYQALNPAASEKSALAVLALQCEGSATAALALNASYYHAEVDGVAFPTGGEVEYPSQRTDSLRKALAQAGRRLRHGYDSVLVANAYPLAIPLGFRGSGLDLSRATLRMFVTASAGAAKTTNVFVVHNRVIMFGGGGTRVDA